MNNILALYVAVLQLHNELHDNLSKTPIFRQSIKSRSNALLKDFEKTVNSLYPRLIEAGVEADYYDCFELCEVFVRLVASKDLALLKSILIEIENGNALVVDEKKHTKILKTFENEGAKI